MRHHLITSSLHLLSPLSSSSASELGIVGWRSGEARGALSRARRRHKLYPHCILADDRHWWVTNWIQRPPSWEQQARAPTSGYTGMELGRCWKHQHERRLMVVVVGVEDDDEGKGSAGVGCGGLRRRYVDKDGTSTEASSASSMAAHCSMGMGTLPVCDSACAGQGWGRARGGCWRLGRVRSSRTHHRRQGRRRGDRVRGGHGGGWRRKMTIGLFLSIHGGHYKKRGRPSAPFGGAVHGTTVRQGQCLHRDLQMLQWALLLYYSANDKV